MLKLLRVITNFCHFWHFRPTYIEECCQTSYWFTRLTDGHIFARTVFPRSLRHDDRLMMCDYLPPPQRGPGSVQFDEIKSFPFCARWMSICQKIFTSLSWFGQQSVYFLLIRMPTHFVTSSFNWCCLLLPSHSFTALSKAIFLRAPS